MARPTRNRIAISERSPRAALSTYRNHKNDNKQAMDCVLLALMAAMDPDRVPVALSVQPTHPSSQIPSRDHYRTTKIKVHAGEGSTSGGRLDDKNLPASHDREKENAL
jgi:hypothetical protein